MSRLGKGVASEGKGATSQEESGIDSNVEPMMAKFMAMMEEKFSGYYKRFDEINGRLERMAKTRSAAQAEVLQETSTQRHGASKVGVTQDTPQTGTRMLQGKGQPSTGHNEEDQDQV